MRVHTVKINWSYPVRFENIYNKDSVYGIGIYCITRKFGANKEKILYIRKTIDTFFNRLQSHEENWINNYRGTKFVRFGTIISPQKIDNDFIEDVESALIYQLRPIHNQKKIKSYTYRTDYFVKLQSNGYRGTVIPEWIDAKTHLDETNIG